MKSNKNGFSIVQVLVVVGIMGIVAAGISQLVLFSVKSSKNAQTMFDMTHVLEEIKSVLGDSINCSRSFNGLSADATRLAVPKVDFLQQQNPAGGFDAVLPIDPNVSVGQNVLFLTDYQLLRASPDPSAVLPNDVLYLYVTFDKADVGQRYQSVRFIKLYVTNNALPIDEVSNRCRAEYVSNDNVWRKVAADPDNIYYDAGKVGVGGEPTINPLHQQPAFPIMFHVHGRSWLQNGLRVGTAGTPLAADELELAGALPFRVHGNSAIDGRLRVGFSMVGDFNGVTNPYDRYFLDVAEGRSIFRGGLDLYDGSFTAGTSPNTANALNIVGNVEIQGNARITGNVSSDGNITGVVVHATSDQRMKKNIVEIKHPLHDLYQLSGVKFDWKKTNEPSLGVIAQQVMEIYPELVSKSESGQLSVNYNGLVAVLIEAIKELDGKVKRLEEQNKNKGNH